MARTSPNLPLVPLYPPGVSLVVSRGLGWVGSRSSSLFPPKTPLNSLGLTAGSTPWAHTSPSGFPLLSAQFTLRGVLRTAFSFISVGGKPPNPHVPSGGTLRGPGRGLFYLYRTILSSLRSEYVLISAQYSQYSLQQAHSSLVSVHYWLYFAPFGVLYSSGGSL